MPEEEIIDWDVQPIIHNRSMRDDEIAMLEAMDRLIRWRKRECWNLHWRVLRNRQGERIGLIKVAREVK